MSLYFSNLGISVGIGRDRPLSAPRVVVIMDGEPTYVVKFDGRYLAELRALGDAIMQAAEDLERKTKRFEEGGSK